MNKKGFTLIELLVVISIISLLSSVVLSSISTARAKARDTRRIQDLLQIQKALALYQSDNSGNLPTGTFHSCQTQDTWSNLKPILVSNYISDLPVDPKHNESTCNDEAGWKYYYYYISSASENLEWGGNGICNNKAVLVSTTAETGKKYRNDCGWGWGNSILLN